MIRKDVETALATLGVPVAWDYYRGDADTYIVYSEYDGRSEAYADDVEIMESAYYQIDIFSKTDYTDLELSLRSAMSNINGTKQYAYSHHEEDWFQRSIRYKFIKMLGE